MVGRHLLTAYDFPSRDKIHSCRAI
ncbi:hypothetical protein BVI434_410159 [Burkholderia vietnamiensis]|nr:hypothetical protein BVI434_410159 [Burkholderia vietnamiensis]